MSWCTAWCLLISVFTVYRCAPPTTSPPTSFKELQKAPWRWAHVCLQLASLDKDYVGIKALSFIEKEKTRHYMSLYTVYIKVSMCSPHSHTDIQNVHITSNRHNVGLRSFLHLWRYANMISLDYGNEGRGLGWCRAGCCAPRLGDELIG